jgi:hypothetical protein
MDRDRDRDRDLFICVFDKRIGVGCGVANGMTFALDMRMDAGE